MAEILCMENRTVGVTVFHNLDTPKTIVFPATYRLIKKNSTRTDILAELAAMGNTFASGCKAVRGLYFQITDLIREQDFTDMEVRQSLSKSFSEPRIAELLKVARAPDEIYKRYALRQIGFGAALREARSFTIVKTERWKNRKLRRSAERLVAMCREAGQNVVSIYVAGCRVDVKPEDGRVVEVA
jgi:hypothetical protein